LPEELKIAYVCEKMGWTYTEYMEQPDWFISVLLIKWNAESEQQKNAK
jgi:hypothetical protein